MWRLPRETPPAQWRFYLGQICMDGIWYNAIGNVGVKPTVTASGRMLVESYLIGYSGDAYGKETKIRIRHFCRPEKKFADVQDMKNQVNADIAHAEAFFAEKAGYPE